MNANEVIAALAGEDVHANDDVNMGQSSNDVFPSAVHLAALEQLVQRPPARRSTTLAEALEREGRRVRRPRQVGPDAPDGRRARSRSGRSSAATRPRSGRGSRASRRRCERVGQIPLGGTATGHGPEHAPRVRRARAGAAGRGDRPHDPAARRPLRGAGGARRARRGLRRAQDRCRLADEDRQRPPPDGLRPARRARRDRASPSSRRAARSCRARSTRSSRRSSRRSRAQVIGNDTAITVGGLQGHFELNVFVPMIARNLLDSIAPPCERASRLLAEKCVDGIEANRETLERYAELTLSAATALNPYIGYDKATEIVKEAAVVRPLAARGRARGRRRRGDARRGARLPRDGAAARRLVRQTRSGAHAKTAMPAYAHGSSVPRGSHARSPRGPCAPGAAGASVQLVARRDFPVELIGGRAA